MGRPRAEELADEQVAQGIAGGEGAQQRFLGDVALRQAQALFGGDRAEVRGRHLAHDRRGVGLGTSAETATESG